MGLAEIKLTIHSDDAQCTLYLVILYVLQLFHVLQVFITLKCNEQIQIAELRVLQKISRHSLDQKLALKGRKGSGNVVTYYQIVQKKIY